MFTIPYRWSLYCIRKNPVYILPSYFLKIHIKIFLTVLMPSKWLCHLKFPHQNPECDHPKVYGAEYTLSSLPLCSCASLVTPCYTQCLPKYAILVHLWWCLISTCIFCYSQDTDMSHQTYTFHSVVQLQYSTHGARQVLDYKLNTYTDLTSYRLFFLTAIRVCLTVSCFHVFIK